MKTIYQKPETEMIILNVQQMVCASGEGGLLGSGSEPEDLDLSNAGTSGATFAVAAQHPCRRKNAAGRVSKFYIIL